MHELNQSCEELKQFGQQELSDDADLDSIETASMQSALRGRVAVSRLILGYNIVLFPFS